MTEEENVTLSPARYRVPAPGLCQNKAPYTKHSNVGTTERKQLMKYRGEKNRRGPRQFNRVRMNIPSPNPAVLALVP